MPFLLFLSPDGVLGEILGAIWLVVVVAIAFFFRRPRLRLDTDWKSKASSRAHGQSRWMPRLPSAGDWSSRHPTPAERRAQQNQGLLIRGIALVALMLLALYEYFAKFRH